MLELSSVPSAYPRANHRPILETLESRLFFSAGASVSATALAASPAAFPLHVSASAATPATAPVTGVQLGGNLQQQTAYTNDHAYVDLIKGAAFNSVNGGPLPTDALGWPLADFHTTLWDNSYGGVSVDPGVYNMSFTGPATTHVSPYGVSSSGKSAPVIARTGYNAATGVNTYTITVPPGVARLGFTFTGTGGTLKNLHVLQPGYSLTSYPVFTTKYVSFLTSLHPFDLRMMDFTSTNNNLVANWANRSVPNGAGYVSKGAPWEYVIQLANQVHSNLWVNVPFHATDDYVRQLATLLKNTLDPSLSIYIEFSNEVWNTAFEQGASNTAAALAEVQAGVKSGHPSDLNYDNQPVNLSQTKPNTGEVITWADRRTARRLLQISNIFKSVWTSAGLANPIDTRVRPILGGQGPVLGRFTNMLKYVSTVYGPPKNFFYGIGIAPYWELGPYTDHQGAGGKYTTYDQNLTAAQILNGMSISIAHFGTQNVFGNSLKYATAYGLKLEAYEGGVDTHGPFNIAAKKAASLSTGIEALMGNYLKYWYSQGGDVLDWYRLGAQSYNTASGTYGLADTLNNLNEPKEIEFRTYRGF